MKTRLYPLAFILALAWLGLPHQHVTTVEASSALGHHHDDDSDSDMPLREQETVRKSYNLGGAHKLLEVDNVFGSIEVVGGQSDQVQLVINKTLRAESAARMESAKKEVTLDVSDEPDLLKFYVNGPFRCSCNDGCNGWNGDRGY